MNSIWSTIEANCWARDLKYSDYVNAFAKTSSKLSGKMLTQSAYESLCAWFDAVYEGELS